MSLRVMFMGTPEFAVPSLIALAEAFDVTLVCTAPDAVRGRGSSLRPSPVKASAEAQGLTVITPRAFDEEFRSAVEQARPDVLCVASYGRILPQWLLDFPTYGSVNVHGSLLPRWHGAAPLERAILAGDEDMGVTIMKIEGALDSGRYCIQRSVAIGTKSFDELSREMAALGAEALVEALHEIEAGTILWREQDESLVTYAHKIAKGELNLDPQETVAVNLRRVQASSTAHKSRLRLNGRALTALRAEALAPEAVALGEGIAPGEVVWREHLLLLGASDGAFVLTSLIPEGKGPMEAASYVAGQAALRKTSGSWGVL